MITEFSVHPKPRNNNAKIAFLITFLISCAGFVTYFFMERFRGLVGLFSLMMLVTAIDPGIESVSLTSPAGMAGGLPLTPPGKPLRLVGRVKNNPLEIEAGCPHR